jgi:hypothetical protein
MNIFNDEYSGRSSTVAHVEVMKQIHQRSRYNSKTSTNEIASMKIGGSVEPRTLHSYLIRTFWPNTFKCKASVSKKKYLTILWLFVEINNKFVFNFVYLPSYFIILCEFCRLCRTEFWDKFDNNFTWHTHAYIYIYIYEHNLINVEHLEKLKIYFRLKL